MEEPPARVELPAAFEEVDIIILVHLIADMLDRLMAHNDQIPLTAEALTRFHSRSAPGISALDYLLRIARFNKAERSCLLITLHYIDQICIRSPLFTLSSLTCHRFLITSITIASKMHCDSFCRNSFYARIGGISVAELDMLEREFLRMIDWKLTCNRDVLQDYYVNLVRTHTRGRYCIVAPETSSSISSDSDMDWETDRSRSPSPRRPTDAPDDRESTVRESSTILADTATLFPEAPHPPTLEQNMAFAEFQQSNRGPSG